MRSEKTICLRTDSVFVKLSAVLGTLFLLTAMVMLCAATGLAAEKPAWQPGKAIHMLVPTGPGGTYDSQARFLANEMSKALKQPVVVENVPGIGQALATNQVYQAKPDGYTLLYTNSTSLILNQYVYNAKYDYRRFEYLGQLWDNTKTVSSVYFTGAKNEIKTWNDVLNLKRPVRFGCVGKGSIPHLMGVATAHAFGLKNPVYVTGYTGSDAYAAGARGEFDLGVFPWSSVEAYTKSGDLRVVLLLSKKEKIPGLEKIPTVGDLGHPEVFDQTATRHVIMAPPDTPKEIAKVLGDVVYASVSGPAMGEFQKKAIDNGRCWAPANGAEARKMVEDTYKLVQVVFPLLKDQR